MSDPEPSRQRQQLSVERRSQNIVKINHRSSASRLVREPDQRDYDPSATVCETSSTKEQQITQNDDHRVFNNSAYNFKHSSLKEKDIMKMQNTGQNFNNQPSNNSKKRNVMKKTIVKSRISYSTKLRSAKHTPATKTYVANPNSFYDRYVEYNNSKPHISPTFSHQNTSVGNDQTSTKRNQTISKEPQIQATGIVPSRFTNQAPLYRHPNIHYKIETSTGVVYESNLQPSILKRFGNLISLMLIGQPLIIKKMTSPSTINGTKLHAYSGYAQQKAKEKVTLSKGFYPARLHH